MLVICSNQTGPVDGAELEMTELDTLNLVSGSVSTL